MTPEQTMLADRIRAGLATETVQRERSMFGGRCFMVNDKLAVCAMRDGSLLVRVDADRHRELLTRAGAEQAVMGPERSMGPGWIRVDAAAVADDLEGWLAEAMACNRRLAASGGR